jgi:hypothetical protein
LDKQELLALLKSNPNVEGIEDQSSEYGEALYFCLRDTTKATPQVSGWSLVGNSDNSFEWMYSKD